MSSGKGCKRLPFGRAASGARVEDGVPRMGTWRFLGRVPYAAGIAVQERLAVERARDRRPDTLLLLEHPPTITLGRRSSAEDLCWSAEDLRRRGIEVVRVGRGGRATYHGPGQLVGYPIVKLDGGGRSVRKFVQDLEEMLLRAVGALGVGAVRRAGHPGIWVGESKLASIGLAVHRRVSQHGFAINVDMDLEPFSTIIPCGIPGLVVSDLSREAGRRVTVPEASAAVIRAWRERFGDVTEEESDEFHCRG